MKYTNSDGSPIGSMGSLEYICTCFAIAGLFYTFFLHTPTKHVNVYAYTTEMNCPDIYTETKHFVGGNLKTGSVTRAVDGCSSTLNIKY